MLKDSARAILEKDFDRCMAGLRAGTSSRTMGDKGIEEMERGDATSAVRLAVGDTGRLDVTNDEGGVEDMGVV